MAAAAAQGEEVLQGEAVKTLTNLRGGETCASRESKEIKSQQGTSISRLRPLPTSPSPYLLQMSRERIQARCLRDRLVCSCFTCFRPQSRERMGEREREREREDGLRVEGRKEVRQERERENEGERERY